LEDLQAACEAAAQASLKGPAERARREAETVLEQWIVLVTCRDDQQQVELLKRLHGDGWECRALLS
jgi:hypothetical protein